MELGWEEESGRQSWVPPGLETSFPSFVCPAAKMVTAEEKRNLLHGAPDTARGWMDAAGGARTAHSQTSQRYPGLRKEQEGFCTKTQRVPACKMQNI